MYPKPADHDKEVIIEGVSFAPGDYFNYKRRNKLGREIYSGCYVIDVDRNDKSVEFFNLREERREEHEMLKIALAISFDRLHKTGGKWTHSE